MKKILVLQSAFLGDVILATALVENIHKLLPDAEISMLVRNGNQSLLKNHPFLKEVLVWDKQKGWFSSMVGIIREVRKRNFDMVFNLQRFFSSGLITALSGATVRSGFNKNPLSFFFTHSHQHIIGDGRHEVDRNLEVCSFIGKPVIRQPRLYPSPADDQTTGVYKSKPYVVMAPASVWFTKQLPVSKWVHLIENCREKFKIYLAGGAADITLCNEIIAMAGNDGVENIAGKFTLLQTASLMRDAVMNYVNDSGPLHIGSAVNAPVTAFFCSTIPAFGFGPLSENSTIVQTTEKLSCRPCGLHGLKQCPEGHFKCATTINIPQSV